MSHAVGKKSSILLASKVESPNLSCISPLVKIGCGLVILETSYDWTVYNHLEERERERGMINKNPFDRTVKTTPSRAVL